MVQIDKQQMEIAIIGSNNEVIIFKTLLWVTPKAVCLFRQPIFALQFSTHFPDKLIRSLTPGNMKVGTPLKKAENMSFISNMRTTFQIFRFLGYFPVKCNKNMTDLRFATISFCFGFLCWFVFTGSIIFLNVDPQGRLQY